MVASLDRKRLGQESSRYLEGLTLNHRLGSGTGGGEHVSQGDERLPFILADFVVSWKRDYTHIPDEGLTR
jgi:hypothetical protein